MNLSRLCWVFFFCFGIFLFVIISANGQEKSRFVRVEVENYFENDRVVISLDTLTLIDKLMTTDQSISLAWSSDILSLSKGTHKLFVELPSMNLKSNLEIADIHDTTTIVVLLNRTEMKLLVGQYKYFKNIRD